MYTEDEPDRYSPNVRSSAKIKDRAYGPDNYESDDRPSEARIGSQLTYMQDSLANLNAIVNGLEDRLQPILIPEEPANVNMPIAAMPPRKPSSELSNSIDDLNGQISRLQGQLACIIERVQL